MLRSTAVIACLFLTTLTSSISAETHSITLDRVEGTHTIGDTTYLVAGQEVEFHLRITNNGTPACFYNPSMAFQVSSQDGAEWSSLSLQYAAVNENWVCCWNPLLCPECNIYFDELFDFPIIEHIGVTGSGADTIGFAGITLGGNSLGIYEGLDTVCLILEIGPTSSSAGMEICLDTVDGINGFEWGWHGATVDLATSCENTVIYPDWDGPHCFTVIDCCGLYTGGESGNIDFDIDGKINLADITRLIDNVYLSKEELSCLANGNIDGDENSDINLADITRLIDRVYVSHQPNSNCQ
jgi:hypothetical protein